jgi:hypothetical protein
MNFCSECGARRGQQAKFCDECGTQFSTAQGAGSPAPVQPQADGPSGESKNLAQRAQLLLNQVSDEDVTAAELDEIIASHKPCFEESLCDLCTHLDEEHGTDIYTKLAENPALNSSQQSEVFRVGSLWQGNQVGLVWAFASNPSVADEMKEVVVHAFDFVVSHVDNDLREYLNSLRKVIEENPRFTHADLDAFDAYGGG